MRISVLHIDSERSWRGGQQQMAYLVDHLQRRGIRTAVVGPPGSALQGYCRRHRHPFFPVRMRGELDGWAGYRIAALCRSRDYTIVHAHTGNALATGLWVKCFAPAVKLIGVRRIASPIRSNPFSRFKYRTPLLDRLVCISEYVGKEAKAAGVPDAKCRIIHSGIDLDRFEPMGASQDLKQRLGVPEGHRVVGTVAAMSPEKDYPTFLKAARILTDEFCRVRFIAVGSGPEKGRVLALADDLGLGKRILFAGFQNDVGRFLKVFDIFVSAARKEGLGTSIMDAQAVGLPVVACRTGGIPELVRHNDNGLLVPPGNAAALAAAVGLLLENSGKRRKFGERAGETVRRFAIPNTVRQYISLYREVTSGAMG